MVQKRNPLKATAGKVSVAPARVKFCYLKPPKTNILSVPSPTAQVSALLCSANFFLFYVPSFC